MSDAISSEDISRAGSGAAAEAMSHVTGAPVMEGKYVYIRGLGDRYSTVQLNGAELPSADPNRRAVPMDLFPSSMLENIVTVKSFTPDKPGNFTGGAVNIGTRSFPDAFTLSISASTTFNTQSSFESGFLTYDGGSYDWLGMDDGTPDLPDQLVDEGIEIPDIGEAFGDLQIAEELDQRFPSRSRRPWRPRRCAPSSATATRLPSATRSPCSGSPSDSWEASATTASWRTTMAASPAAGS